MAVFMLSRIRVSDRILHDEKYKFLYSVEEVNKLVLSGIPFRDAYQKIGSDIEQGKFTPSKELHHTHEGSLGNLANDQIKRMFVEAMGRFHFELAETALDQLVR